MESLKKSGVFEDPKLSFYEMVFEVVKQVPRGRVTTYGAIAAYLGARKSLRLVGWALNRSHQTNDPIPAQRVVNRNGMLSGKRHFGDNDEMQKRLAMDGVAVENDSVVGFATLFWDPAEHLGIADDRAFVEPGPDPM